MAAPKIRTGSWPSTPRVAGTGERSPRPAAASPGAFDAPKRTPPSAEDCPRGSTKELCMQRQSENCSLNLLIRPGFAGGFLAEKVDISFRRWQARQESVSLDASVVQQVAGEPRVCQPKLLFSERLCSCCKGLHLMTMSECEDGDDEDLLLTRKAYRQAVATSPGYAKNASFFMPRSFSLPIGLSRATCCNCKEPRRHQACKRVPATGARHKLGWQMLPQCCSCSVAKHGRRRSYCPQLGADARFQGRLASTDASSVGVA